MLDAAVTKRTEQYGLAAQAQHLSTGVYAGVI